MFAFVVTNRGAGHALAGKGYKEYRLGDYSTWLQKRVQNSNNWGKIQSCLSDGEVCSSLSKYTSLYSFNSANLSPVQSGCCKPPTACGYVFQNATIWVSPVSPYADSDCRLWSNDQTQLCFSCNSCKAGVLYNIKHDWRIVAAVNIVVFVLLIVIYSIGCAAFRNARREGYYGTDYDKGYDPRTY
ncbi:hypothetical protein O6H91_20G063500 [Diphasiastrum complanatum]|uniref:Uncharacterized protein n=1 Tax=Diphasiastrum complanatum TaxID=34168 RepID=A0ACC2AR70_DIPCM|nr:hypothetical protein O6H91_20G063500 [Diphasiastrum complanatum]